MSDSARRDLNGRVRPVGAWARMRARFVGRTEPESLDLHDRAVRVVAASADDAEASSAVLAGSRWRPDDEVILRHVLALPDDRLAEALEVAALDRYEALDPAAAVDAGRWPAVSPSPEGGRSLVVLARVQLLDAVHLSQERSRMASLGSRHGGHVLCWEVLQR